MYKDFVTSAGNPSTADVKTEERKMTTEHYEEERLKDQQQNRVWNLGGSKSLRLVVVTLLQKSDRPHRQESMKFSFLHRESDAGASCFRKSLYIGLIRGCDVLIYLYIF